jgi:hypothetical protein
VDAGRHPPYAGTSSTRQALQSAQRIVERPLDFAVDADRSDLAGEGGEHRLALDASEQLADAHMDAGAVADMAGRAPFDHVGVGPLPFARIAIGGAEQHQHLFAFAQLNPADIDRPRRRAKEGLYRRFEADRLFERGARQRGIGVELRHLVRESRQAIDRGGQSVDGRINPGAQERTDQKRRLFGRDLAGFDRRMDARPDPVRRKVLALALFRDPGDMRRGALYRVAAQFVVRAEGVEHRAGIGKQMFAAVFSKPHRVGKDRERVGLGESWNRVEATRLDELVRQGLRGRGKRVAKLLHHRSRQRAIKHRAGAVVFGRVLLQDETRRTPRPFFGEIAHPDAAAGAEGPPVVENAMHLLVARDRP